MKKLFSMILLAVIALTAFAQNQTKTIALLEPRAGDGSVALSPMEKAMVRGELRKAIVKMPGYQAITRADIDQIMNEQNFQRTGMVSEEQIKQMGEMSGADYICVSTLTKSNTEFYLEAYLIHVESGRMFNPASQYGELTNGKFANMLPVCEMLAKELLEGTNTQAKQQVEYTPSTQNQDNNSQTEENALATTMPSQSTLILEDGTTVQLLWNDPTYPEECRKAGEKAYYKAVWKNANPVFKDVKKSGFKGREAQLKASLILIKMCAKIANDAVLQCSEGK